MLHGGETGPAVVPGQAGKSLLYRFVTSADESAMPKTGPKLTGPQRALVESWIKAGAPYDRTLGKAGQDIAWWSLQPVKKPVPPAPGAELRTWPRNPIDCFVLDRLLDKGLRPSPAADRRALIRRGTVRPIWLPPTPGRVHPLLDGASRAPLAKGGRW